MLAITTLRSEPMSTPTSMVVVTLSTSISCVSAFSSGASDNAPLNRRCRAAARRAAWFGPSALRLAGASAPHGRAIRSNPLRSRFLLRRSSSNRTSEWCRLPRAPCRWGRAHFSHRVAAIVGVAGVSIRALRDEQPAPIDDVRVFEARREALPELVAILRVSVGDDVGVLGQRNRHAGARLSVRPGVRLGRDAEDANALNRRLRRLVCRRGPGSHLAVLERRGRALWSRSRGRHGRRGH